MDLKSFFDTYGHLVFKSYDIFSDQLGSFSESIHVWAGGEIDERFVYFIDGDGGSALFTIDDFEGRGDYSFAMLLIGCSYCAMSLDSLSCVQDYLSELMQANPSFERESMFETLIATHHQEYSVITPRDF